MLTKQIYKERSAANSAANYLFGGEKVSIIGPRTEWQMELMKRIFAPRKKSIMEEIMDCYSAELDKPMAPKILYRLEPPNEGEFVAENYLTFEEFKAQF